MLPNPGATLRSLQNPGGERKVRVVHLLDRLGGGGVAQVAMNAALGLDPDRYSSTVCTTRTLDALDHIEMLNNGGVDVIQLDRTSSRDLLAWKPLLDLLKTTDVLHSHDSTTNMYGRVFGRLARVPVLITHDHQQPKIKGQAAVLRDRTMRHLSDCILAVSEVSRDNLLESERHNPDTVRVIRNGIDVSRFDFEIDQAEARALAGLPRDGFIVSILANFGHKKNHRNLFDAFSRVLPQIEGDAYLVVAGDGPERESIVELAREFGISDQTLFLGLRADTPMLLKATDILTLPSKSEAMPIVLLEALAARVPVVSSPVGGIPEIFEGVDWPLVDPLDPEEIARGILTVKNMSTSERSDLSETGYARVRNLFSQEAFVSQVEATYREFIEKAGIRS